MAILALATSLKDLRERIGRIVLGLDKAGKAVTTEDLGVAGAMTILMKDALKPNILQTLEEQLAFVHAGPFANIAHGNSSVLADLIATKVGDYVVTESGFGADMGFEKFMDIKCRASGLMPDAVVLVATVRALKMHGGGPKVTPGKPLATAYTQENRRARARRASATSRPTWPGRAEDSACPPSSRSTPSPPTARPSGTSSGTARSRPGPPTPWWRRNWAEGGDGAAELAEAVEKAAAIPPLKPLYELETPIKAKIETIAREVYGASG